MTSEYECNIVTIPPNLARYIILKKYNLLEYRFPMVLWPRQGLLDLF